MLTLPCFLVLSHPWMCISALLLVFRKVSNRPILEFDRSDLRAAQTWGRKQGPKQVENGPTMTKSIIFVLFRLKFPEVKSAENVGS